MQLIVREHLLPRRIVAAASADWPGDDWPGWMVYGNGKRASRGVELAPPSIVHALHALADAATLFTPDSFPDMSFYGAGLHEIPAGGSLGWHRDAARHPLRPWRRTETAILYLDHGGALCFRGGLGSSVPAEPGRVVTFLPDGETEHCVEASGNRRRSLAVFFYVVDPAVTGSTSAEFSR